MRTLLSRASRRLHGSVQRARWSMARTIAPRRTVRMRGVRFSVQCDNRITYERWRSAETKEPETLDWIDECLGPDDVLFDVGANLGLYSLYAALRHPGLRVVAFEPEYANAHLLRDNVVHNGLRRAVETYSIALGDASGLSWLHVQDMTSGAALHTEAPQPLATTESGRPVVWSEGIWVARLDEFCERRELRPTAIKIDVDGGEARVLGGARVVLSSPELRTLILEVNEAPAAVCERLLGDAGLTLARMGQTNHIWSRTQRTPAPAATAADGGRTGFETPRGVTR